MAASQETKDLLAPLEFTLSEQGFQKFGSFVSQFGENADAFTTHYSSFQWPYMQNRPSNIIYESAFSRVIDGEVDLLKSNSIGLRNVYKQMQKGESARFSNIGEGVELKTDDSHRTFALNVFIRSALLQAMFPESPYLRDSYSIGMEFCIQDEIREGRDVVVKPPTRVSS